MVSVARKVLFVVPAFNEEKTVEAVVRSIVASFPDARVLVVDDGSYDETTNRARAAGAMVARHAGNLGVGAAVRTGLHYAHQEGHHAVVQVDADGQHDPAQATVLLDELEEADVVVGSRFLGVADYEISWLRRAGIWLLSRSVSRLCKSQITDATSGFRAFGSDAIAFFARFYPTEYLGDTVESLALAGKVGLKVVEVPVNMYVRKAGRPSQSLLLSILHLFRSAFVVLQSSLHRVPPEAHFALRRRA
jgi:glycosyltransferase involved in cell wall biosynthesis